jgi:hypothetical protein
MKVETPYSGYLEAETVDEAIEEFAQLIDVETNLRTLSESIVNHSRVGRRWTRKEELGHLIDSALNNHQRFVRRQIHQHVTPPMLEDGTLFIDGYAQDEWVEVNYYSQRQWQDLVTLWVALNKQILHVMQYADEAAKYSPVVIDGGSPVLLHELMIDYVGHVKHHLEKIVHGTTGDA